MGRKEMDESRAKSVGAMQGSSWALSAQRDKPPSSLSPRLLLTPHSSQASSPAAAFRCGLKIDVLLSLTARCAILEQVTQHKLTCMSSEDNVHLISLLCSSKDETVTSVTQ